MRLTVFLLTAAFLNVYAKGVSQNISFSGKGVSLENVFAAIEKQTPYLVFYSRTSLVNSHPVTIKVADMPLKEFLDILFKDQPFTYSIRSKTINVTPNLSAGLASNRRPNIAGPDSTKGSAGLLFFPIRIKVVDMNGKPLTDASVTNKKSKNSGVTNAEGVLVFQAEIGDILEISYVGFESTTYTIKNKEESIVVQLKASDKKLDEVVVSTGMFDRRKETFTGVTKTYSGKEVRSASRQNVLEALNLLDPSLKIIRNGSLGSDPNQLPKVEMRGSRTLPPPVPEKYSQQLKLQYENDPNQPLFILDGFETDLSTIVNLDINRIESITLLKDAASTALYGSRSANGVVVVETIRPATGKLQVNYNLSATMSIADLNGYNMMDAKELLKFQELTSEGVDAPGPFAIDAQGSNILLPQLKHAFRQNAVSNGVNSNWMKVPLQYAGELDHKLSVTGGDGFFNYLLGMTKSANIGVMRGSENKNNTGFAILSYRKGKINVSNNLTISGQKRQGSPYGSFADYVRVPSYYRVNNTGRYLEEHHAEYYYGSGFKSSNDFRFANPLYNANLPHKNIVEETAITNNLMLNWNVLPYLRVTGSLQYRTTSGRSDYFISPLNTKFDQVDALQRGSYDQNSSKTESYNGFLTLTFNKVYAEKHIVNMNLRGDLKSTNTEGQSIAAVGYATTAEPLIYLANSYRPDGKPGGSAVKQNSMGLIASLNYSYDMRYNLDISYNRSGTSNFGSDNPYQSFYAVGLGWNIGREDFLSRVKWINYLNLTGNIGLTSNVNAGNFGSRSTYQLENAPTWFGESVKLKGWGTPDLGWTKTYNMSYSLSGKFFQNKFSLSLSGYRNLTDPLIISMPVPLSVGIAGGVPKNIGKLTQSGLEVIADTRLLNTRDWTLTLGVHTTLFYKNTYSGFGNSLQKFNDSARKAGYTQRYFDGASPDDVWAVRSLGIGEARGLEVFLDKNGRYTFLFDKNNEVVVGSSRPVSQGNVNMRVRFRRFTLSVYTRYVVEEMKFNTALFNKVENISVPQLELNQDRRALYTRWQKIGDNASFLGIKNKTLGMSSRFLQKENALYVDGINFNYDLLDEYSKGLKDRLRKKLGLQALSFALNTSNIFQFQLSNIKLERGLDYPFQRSVTFTLNMTF